MEDDGGSWVWPGGGGLQLEVGTTYTLVSSLGLVRIFGFFDAQITTEFKSELLVI